MDWDLRSLARRMVLTEDMMVENWACIGFGFCFWIVWDWDCVSYSGIWSKFRAGEDVGNQSKFFYSRYKLEFQ